MESNRNHANLRVSLHAADDLKRSLDSNASHQSDNFRSSTMDSRADARMDMSRSSGVSLWDSTDSHTWPISRTSVTPYNYTRVHRFKHSSDGAGSCLLHSHAPGGGICPFDGSKYRLAAYSGPAWGRKSYTSHRSISSSNYYNKFSGKLRSDYLSGTSSTGREYREIAELEDQLTSSLLDISAFGSFEKAETDPSCDEIDMVTDTSLNSDLWRPLRLRSYTEANYLERVSSCKIEDMSSKSRPSAGHYGHLASSSARFPSRFSLKSVGNHGHGGISGYSHSHEDKMGDLGTITATKNNNHNSGHNFRLELEDKYEHYKETYLTSSPEQELRTLNAAILNVRKWLRKRHEALKNLSARDSNKLSDSQGIFKKLITEAKKQQEGVDILLDRGQRFLAQRANIVLEVDLENLVFLWNGYVEGLRKLHLLPVAQEDKLASDIGSLNKADTCTESVTHQVPTSSSQSQVCLQQSHQEEVVAGGDSNWLTHYSPPVLIKEQISVEEKDRNSLSSGGSDTSCDVSYDLSLADSRSLTLDDLKTATSALDIFDLSHQPTQVDCAESLPLDTAASKVSGFVYQSGDGSVSAVCELEDSSEDEGHDVSAAVEPGDQVTSSTCSTEKMEMEKPEKCPDVAEDGAESDVVCDGLKKDSPDVSRSPNFDKETSPVDDTDARADVGALITFDIPGVKVMEASEGSNLPSEAKRRRMLLETPATNTSNLSSRSESPLSLDSSRSETPTGTLTRAERQNELWRAIGSINTFLMDKDILEACKSTASDWTSEEDEEFAGAPNVSFAEFLQQYRELTDWLNQVHKVTQKEVTSLSEKYLNQSYHEEMLERSPRREFLNSYSRQLLLRYPNMAEQISARMSRLNCQWKALEQAIVAKHGRHDAETMLRDLECDLNTLRRWLNAVEARLQPLTIQADWTDAELEDRLHRHQALQRDIESHNKIVNAVLKLSERLEQDVHACSSQRERDSLQLVAQGLERRWHGIWLQSLEWQCRLEEAISRRKGPHSTGFDFSGFSLPVLDESLFNSSTHDINDHGLIQLDDDSLLFIGHRGGDFADNYRSSEDGQKSFDLSDQSSAECLFACVDSEAQTAGYQEEVDCSSHSVNTSSSGANTPTEPRSPTRPSAFNKPESPLGKRPFPGFASGDASPAKRGSQSPSSSSGGASPVVQGSPLESFITSRGLHIHRKEEIYINSLQDEDEQRSLKVRTPLFDRSSGDSANISETESKMGDSPPANVPFVSRPEGPGGYVITSSDGEIDPPSLRSGSKTEVKDIGYSSESQSNDEVDVMRHQIDMEYKFPGKCEVASDGPLGDKINMPPVQVRTDYYCMTHDLDIDSTDKTDNGDTTDSERVRDVTDKQGPLVEPEKISLSASPDSHETNSTKDSESLEASWESDHFPSPLVQPGYLGSNQPASTGVMTELSEGADQEPDMLPSHQVFDFSESDSAPESKGKKSIRYLIDHAEDLVKPTSPHHSCPSSPIKQQSQMTSVGHSSPSKHTQTDSCSTVESSCDASGEDNSDCEAGKAVNVGEEFSTATDEAEETLFNSVINLDSAADVVDASPGVLTYDSSTGPVMLDSPRLRKQTGTHTHRRGKKDRPWSVVGLQEDNSLKKNDTVNQIVAASESAIDHLHCHTDTDSSFPIISHSSTFPRESRSGNFRRAFSSSDQTSTAKSAKRKLKYSAAATATASASTSATTSSSHHEDIQEGSSPTTTTTTTPTSSTTTKFPYSDTSSAGDKSPRKNRRSRRLRRRSSLEKERGSPTLSRSSTTESYDSAEAESESETTDEYLTAPMDMVTSDAEDVHNLSGSLSEHSTWDNYQMMYPTASEDPGEELLAWEPQEDELEFDDDFQLTKQSRSIVTEIMSNGQQRHKLKFNKQGVVGEDSDSDLEDFHHILDQSELALKLADQSLRKKRKNPMGTGLHLNPAKYGEIIATYETNIKCLETICQHLTQEAVTDTDIHRVQDLMYQWEKLYALASERHSQAKDLAAVMEMLAKMKLLLKEAEDCLPFDRFSSAEELKVTISLLKEKQLELETQGQKLGEMQKQLTEFSVLHPTIRVDKYLQELASMQKSTTFLSNKVSEHLELLQNNWSVWLEYLDSQRELDMLLAADRERLHKLLCQRDYGVRVTKKDVLKELETLQNNLSIYESKLSELQTMKANLTRTSNHEAQQQLLASLADLRNQLLVVSERCRQIYRDVEEDEDIPLDKQAHLGKLAMSAAALHEVLKKPSSSKSLSSVLTSSPQSASDASVGVSRTCASWLRSLPVQVVALMFVAGLVYALDPDILDRLANFTLTITPELQYVNGPPTI